MKLDPAILYQPADDGIRAVALALLADAHKAADRLASRPSADALHAFRVALRRLRSWLRGFKRELKGAVRQKDRRALREVAHATNLGRDVDVLLVLLRRASKGLRSKRRKGADWLARYIKARKRRAGDPLDAALLYEFEQVATRLEEKLSEPPKRTSRARPRRTLAAALSERLPAHADQLELSLGKVRSEQDEQPAHQARIAAKRLRYLLEPVAPFVKSGPDMLGTLKSMQDELGALHDIHIMGHEIGVAMEHVATAEASRLSARALGRNAPRKAATGLLVKAPRDGLLSVAEHVRDDAREQYKVVRKNWLRGGRGAPRLNRDVATIAKRLANSGDKR
jgi:CHAD domain-containing protein